MDTWASISKGFESEFFRLQYRYEAAAEKYFGNLTEEQALQLGAQAARTVFAPFIWDAQVGERWDVRLASEFLGISRQALYKRVRTGTALGVPGRGTTYFPVWQFDFDKHLIRQVVGEILGAFQEADEEIDPLVIAAWATKGNRLLRGESPAEWISQGRDDVAVLAAARRAAAGLSA
jgi:hypothetical protein